MSNQSTIFFYGLALACGVSVSLELWTIAVILACTAGLVVVLNEIQDKIIKEIQARG